MTAHPDPKTFADPNKPAGAADPVRLALAERAVPRYTSYPTAPHFSEAVGEAEHRRWLAELSPETSLSLYLHVPFCAAMCVYCGCHTKVTRKDEPIEAYFRRLLAEIAMVSAATPARKVARLHWGGGTPSMLGAERLAALVDALSGAFDLTDLVEHAIELDPRQTTPELARALAAMGVTRASLGVQDLNPHVQRVIGRVQPFEVVRAAADALREAGIGAVNVDLMYGLPHQSESDLIASIDQVATLRPDRVALFGYAHVPWFKTHQKLIPEAALPDAPARLAAAEAGKQALVALGYRPIGFDHFALAADPLAMAAEAGALKRNFQGYTDDDCGALLGFGASAIGRLPQGFVQNAPDFGRYDRAIDAGRLPTARGLALTAEDRLRADAIETIMCRMEADLDIVARRHDRPDGYFAEDLAALAPLEAAGFVRRDGARIEVPEAGRPFLRLVAACFDARLKQAGRHSAAV